MSVVRNYNTYYYEPTRLLHAVKTLHCFTYTATTRLLRAVAPLQATVLHARYVNANKSRRLSSCHVDARSKRINCYTVTVKTWRIRSIRAVSTLEYLFLRPQI